MQTLQKPLILLSIVTLAMLNGCSDPESWINQRNPDYERPAIEVATSQLQLPIRLPLNELERILSDRLPRVLVKNKEIKNGFTITMARSGAISLSGDGRVLRWSVPVEVTVGHRILGTDLSTFEVRPDFNSAIAVHEDYSLSSETQLKDVTWITPATVRLFSKNVDLTDILDEILMEERGKISSIIDRELQKVNLKQILQKTWSKLSNPIRINRKVQPVYILVTPSKLELNDYYFNDGALSLELGVQGMLSTVFDSASYAVEEAPYPRLIIETASFNNNALYLPLVLGFDRVNGLLKEQLTGLEFDVEGQKLKLDSVNINSIDSNMLITVRVSGDVSLEAELLGRPSYHPSQRTLSVTDFDYQVRNSDRSLLDMGDYFFHDAIIDEVKSRLNLPIGSFIDTIPSLIYNGVERGNSGGNLELLTNLDSISLDQIHIGANDMALVVFAKGDVEIQVQKLKAKGNK